MIQEVNGIKIYYEVYGEGRPLIMLHGNGESHHIYDGIADRLKDSFKIYLVDSRCHGNSSRNSSISYSLMASDIEELIKALGINNPIIYGFSDGGIIALMLAINKRVGLEKIIISGANLNPNGLDDRTIMEALNDYKMTNNSLSRLMLLEPNIKPYELKEITIPVHILAGENDVVKYEHTSLIYSSITNATLEIIKNENHYSYVMDNNKLYSVLIKYLGYVY